MARYYIDCEFDGYRGPLLSMALVRDDGESRYWVAPPVTPITDPWVYENVVPIIYNCPAKPWPNEALSEMIQTFLDGDRNPVIIADWPDDIRYFCEAIITGPGEMIHVPGLTFEMHRVDAYPTTLEGAVQHNAWWDAMALRHKLRQEI